MRARYTVRLFGPTAHALRNERETACGQYVPPYQPRYAVRPRGAHVCRKCGAGQ